MQYGSLAVLAVLATTALAVPQRHAHKASPFDAIRWEEDFPVVQVAAGWYQPVAVDALSVTDIIGVCKKRWPGQLRKRFSEDLMEAMTLLGAEPGDTVTLKLLRTSDGTEVTLKDVPNTHAKREQLRAANNRSNEKVSLSQDEAKVSLSQDEAKVDLRAFVEGLRERFAYLELKGLDWEGELDDIEKNLEDPILTAQLAANLHRLMMRFGDGHASVTVRGFRPGEDGPFLPFLLADSAGGVVAFASGRDTFVDPDRPILASLAGFPIEDCLAAVYPYVVDGSPQLVRRRAMRLLRDVSLWYPLLTGEKPPSLITLELSTGKDAQPREVTVGLTDRKPTYGDWPRNQSKLLDGSIGYLRLQSMDDDAVAKVHRWMAKFRDTRALVVDVRGNGGGSRAALLALAGYFVGPQGPWVANIAAYRLANAFSDDHLAARFVYRADYEDWTDAQKTAIEEASSAFVPEWEPPDGFSQWHYLVLDRTGHAGEYHYDRPVVVLSDAGCFSATDIFLAALELHPSVTLIGTPSGGGSARAQQFKLPNSGIRVRCASMASFRPSGRTYDGRGVEVDIETLPYPGFFLQEGRDAALEAAVALLKKQ